jgi:hypothetical protein
MSFYRILKKNNNNTMNTTGLKKILSECELKDNNENGNTFSVFYCEDSEVFYAIENNEPKALARCFMYQTTENLCDIIENKRDEILSYTLGRYYPEDVVTEADVFLHGGYLDRIYKHWSVEKKDRTEYLLIKMFVEQGEIPYNYEDIVQDCYEYICENFSERWLTSETVKMAYNEVTKD